MGWLNDNAGAIQGVAAAVVAALTAGLVWWNRRYVGLTRETLKETRKALGVAESALETARAANVISEQVAFGAYLVVKHDGDDRFTIANIGPGVARNVIADYEVEGTATGDSPEKVMPILAGRDAPDGVVGVRWVTKPLAPPGVYQWPPTNQGWPPPGGVPARLRLRYDDAFRKEVKAYSETIYLLPPGKPQVSN